MTQLEQQIADYRRYLWAQIKQGVDLDEATKYAPAWAVSIVATARRRQARVDAHLKVITGPAPDARSEVKA